MTKNLLIAPVVLCIPVARDNLRLECDTSKIAAG